MLLLFHVHVTVAAGAQWEGDQQKDSMQHSAKDHQLDINIVPSMPLNRKSGWWLHWGRFKIDLQNCVLFCILLSSQIPSLSGWCFLDQHVMVSHKGPGGELMFCCENKYSIQFNNSLPDVPPLPDFWVDSLSNRASYCCWFGLVEHQEKIQWLYIMCCCPVLTWD